ncbi:phage protein [Streptomyces laurentii]|uniref:Phage protein n=1 Tax=Streptomyces laurentii TaxID=39478 RepID=A0A160NZH5_STRLU|nr:phage protein [Streptomyces laurentii]
MSGIRFEFDPRCLPEVMRSQPVRAALRKQADEIAPRARALARAEIGDEFADSITVAEETRPKGRPTAKVVADRVDAQAHEYGDTDTERRRILGRAARTGEG